MNFGTSARAVIIKDSHLLVESWANGTRTFLPGGRVNPEESINDSLLRELNEEIGATDVTIGRYLGKIHSKWKEGHAQHESLGHFFMVEWASGSPATPVRSPEVGRAFCWIKISELREKNLVPPTLQKLIPKALVDALVEEWDVFDDEAGS